MRTKQATWRRAVRKTAKWGGAGLTVLLVVVWIGSCWRVVGVRRVGDIWHSTSFTWLAVESGRLTYGEMINLTPAHGISVSWFKPRASEMKWLFGSTKQANQQAFFAPLWPAALLSLLATAAAWRADAKCLRRAREGACPECGYDRAGLAPGAVCPECGAAADVRNPPASD